MDDIHHLFEKELTTSDVGSKMIVPKQDFDSFVQILRSSREHIENGKYSSGNIQAGVDLSVLDFRDGEELTMTLKLKRQKTYFALQKGWSDFVESRELQSGDTVQFLWRARDEQILIYYERTHEPRGKI